VSKPNDKRAASIRLAEKIHQSAKTNGGNLTFEQAQKMSAKAMKKTDRK
jgi:hypothetical protein